MNVCRAQQQSKPFSIESKRKKENMEKKSISHLFIGVNSIRDLNFDIGLTGLCFKNF